MASDGQSPSFSFKRLRSAIHGETNMHLESQKLPCPERLVAAALLALFIIGFSGPAAAAQPTKSAKPTFDKNSPFYFDGTISRQTLENYLDRAITMGYFLVPGQPESYQFPYRDDDVRMIHNLGAKFIGRAIYRWGEESKLGDPAFLEHAKKLVDSVHAVDPEIIFQGCLFEQVSADINKLKIPTWVFEDFGLPLEDRTFSRAEIIKRTGKGGGRGGVPIINNLETRLWFYYLAVSYIKIGCEAFHLGQVALIGADDRDLKVYSEFLAKVRAYAKLHARRHVVLMDGHVPSGGMVKDGVSLLDFNSFPMRIKAVPGKWVPGKPQEAVLEVGHLDAIFKRSKGCISPSGVKCDSLPYLVEFDNFGRGPNPNVADPKSMFCWGWDEISWFAQQPEEYRNHWLIYAHNWVKQTDPNGHLQMPGIRMITCPNETLRSYFANTKSKACPVGYSQEETIKKIWSGFSGEKTAWHGFDRYDFLMDEANFTIKPIKAAPDEKNGIKGQVQGQLRCVVVVPKEAAPGKPWSWRGYYFDHKPQAEIELLKRGFHIGFVLSDAGMPWDAWYQFLTETHGLSKKPAFIGMSRGGRNAYTWATLNPDKVSAIYADNPAISRESLMKLGELAQRDLPLLHICGSLNPILGHHTLPVESLYQHLGGRISVMIKDGVGHHPHSLRDPTVIADFIVRSLQPATGASPAFAGKKFTKHSFYGIENIYRDFPKEGMYITCRGPWFSESYFRYEFKPEGVNGTVAVVAPNMAAPGNPWVLRADFVTPDAVIDLALLGKGFHIVTGPVGTNANGPQLKQWNALYEYLTRQGLSPKPVMEGASGAAGDAYAWAIANPDKVSCIYSENPILRSNMSKAQPLDNLAALAKAGVPLLHVCGSLDPWLKSQTEVAEKRYREFGGQILVIIKAGDGHYPLAPKDRQPVVDFIVKAVSK
jgi:hypothetical protein